MIYGYIRISLEMNEKYPKQLQAQKDFLLLKMLERKVMEFNNQPLVKVDIKDVNELLEKEHEVLFTDIISPMTSLSEREGFQDLVNVLEEGDTIMIPSLDTLSTDSFEFQSLKTLMEEKKFILVEALFNREYRCLDMALGVISRLGAYEFDFRANDEIIRINGEIYIPSEDEEEETKPKVKGW